MQVRSVSLSDNDEEWIDEQEKNGSATVREAVRIARVAEFATWQCEAADCKRLFTADADEDATGACPYCGGEILQKVRE